MWKFLSLLTGCQTSNDAVIYSNHQNNNKKTKYDDENEIATLDLTVKPSNNTNGIRKNINIPLIAISDNSPISNKGNVSSINDDLLLFLSNVYVEKDDMEYKYDYKTNTLNAFIASNALLELLYNVIMNNNTVTDIKTITQAIHTSIEIISSKFVLGFTQIQTSPYSTSPVANYDNTSLALDGIVIMLDILQLAILRFVENLKADNELNSLSNITLFGPLERLFSNFGEVSSSVSCSKIGRAHV
jgi:hypothetical protein